MLQAASVATAPESVVDAPDELFQQHSSGADGIVMEIEVLVQRSPCNFSYSFVFHVIFGPRGVHMLHFSRANIVAVFFKSCPRIPTLHVTQMLTLVKIKF